MKPWFKPEIVPALLAAAGMLVLVLTLPQLQRPVTQSTPLVEPLLLEFKSTPPTVAELKSTGVFFIGNFLTIENAMTKTAEVLRPRQPDHPDEIEIKLTTTDGKKWRAKWTEDKL